MKGLNKNMRGLNKNMKTFNKIRFTSLLITLFMVVMIAMPTMSTAAATSPLRVNAEELQILQLWLESQ